MEYKGYLIENDGTFGYKTIKLVGRGSVHAALRGVFTNIRMAQKAIDNFVSSKEKVNA